MGFEIRTSDVGGVDALKVVLYIRESNHNNAEAAIKRQRDRLNDFCKSNGYEIYDSVYSKDSRQGSWNSFMKAIERAKETKDKTIVMVSTNRIIGTRDDLVAVESVIKEAGITIKTLDGKYEDLKKNNFDTETLICNFLMSVDNKENAEA